MPRVLRACGSRWTLAHRSLYAELRSAPAPAPAPATSTRHSPGRRMQAEAGPGPRSQSPWVWAARPPGHDHDARSPLPGPSRQLRLLPPGPSLCQPLRALRPIEEPEKLRLFWELSWEPSGARPRLATAPPKRAGTVTLSARPTPEGPGHVASAPSSCGHCPKGGRRGGRAAAAPAKRPGRRPAAARPLGGALGQGNQPVRAGRPPAHWPLPAGPWPESSAGLHAAKIPPWLEN